MRIAEAAYRLPSHPFRVVSTQLTQLLVAPNDAGPVESAKRAHRFGDARVVEPAGTATERAAPDSQPGRQWKAQVVFANQLSQQGRERWST